MKSLIAFLWIVIAASALAQQTELIPYRTKADKWGYCDKQKNIIIPAQYDEVEQFEGNTAKICKEKLYGFVDKSGKEVLPPRYSRIGDFSEGYARVYNRNEEKYGFIDSTFKEVIPMRFDGVGEFSNGLAKVAINGKQGYIDRKGTFVIAPQHYIAGVFYDNGYAQVKMDMFGAKGLINRKGRVVLDMQYQKIESFSSGFALIAAKGEYGFINRSCSIVVPLGYYHSENSFSEGLARVQRGYEYSFIDTTLNIVLTPPYKTVLDFSCGLAAVQKDSTTQWGFIDHKGKEVIPAVYDEVQNFIEGFACVRVGKKWGIIDQRGKEVAPAIYDKVEKFSEGFAWVQVGKKWTFINQQGKEIIPPRYEEAQSFSNGYAGIYMVGKWGIIDKTGEEIIPPRYDSIGDFSKGYFRAVGGSSIFSRYWLGYVGVDGTEYWDNGYTAPSSANSSLSKKGGE